MALPVRYITIRSPHGQWAIQQRKYAQRARPALGFISQCSFSGAFMHNLLFLGPAPTSLVNTGIRRARQTFGYLPQAFWWSCVDVCYELHPEKTLLWWSYFRTFLDKCWPAQSRQHFCTTPSHFCLQQTRLSCIPLISIMNALRTPWKRCLNLLTSVALEYMVGYQSWIDRPGRCTVLVIGQIDFKGYSAITSITTVRCGQNEMGMSVLNILRLAALEGEKFHCRAAYSPTEKAFGRFCRVKANTLHWTIRYSAYN